MTTLTVRRARPEDGERIRDLNEFAMSETPEWVPDAPDADLRDVQTHYVEAGGEFLVGVREGRIVATGAYEPLNAWMGEQFPPEGQPAESPGHRPSESAVDQPSESAVDQPSGSTLELSRMRVDPACWGLGYGTRIYEELASRAREEGYRTFVLNTGVDNDRARGFYESLGFETVREVTVEFGDVTLELALYRHELDRVALSSSTGVLARSAEGF